MKRFWTVLSGVCLFLALCVVPSFASSPALDSLSSGISPYATSTTPVYPSGSNYPYFVGSEPSSRPGYSSGDYFTAVANSLRNGFVTMSKGLYDLQRSFTLYSTAFDTFSADFTRLKTNLIGNWTGFSYLSSTVGLSSGTNGSSLYAISQSLYNGFYQTITQLKDVGTKVSNLNTGLSSSVSVLDSHFTSVFPGGSYPYVKVSAWKPSGASSSDPLFAIASSLSSGFWVTTDGITYLRSSFDGLQKNLFDGKTSYVVRDYSVTTGEKTAEYTVSGSYNMIYYNLLNVNGLLAGILRNLYNPVDDALEDASEDQKKEILDNFFGDDGNGVKPGQIGDLGGISSGAGSLLDTGADMGSVFDEIGNPGSSVWSWFTAGNSEAINGAPSSASEMTPYSLWDAPEPSPTVEVVDFYGAQREEFFSMLGGG